MFIHHIHLPRLHGTSFPVQLENEVAKLRQFPGLPGGWHGRGHRQPLLGYLYTYDAWGNLLSQAGWTSYYGTCTETTMGTVTANGSNQISGLTYDASGNTLGDGNYSCTWDGESQMKTAGGVTYAYDGDGRRVAKVGSKLYWYGSARFCPKPMPPETRSTNTSSSAASAWPWCPSAAVPSTMPKISWAAPA